MSDSKHILLVEDEPNFGSVLSQFLTLHGFKVSWAKNGAEGWAQIKGDKRFDCCVLDVMMPEMDGFALGNELRQSRPKTPFIYLTAKAMKDDMIQGYKVGADDYVLKPFDSEILVLKINALLNRHVDENQGSVFEIGTLQFDAKMRTLRSADGEKRLSPKECSVLLILARNLNNLVSREELITRIWGEDNYFTRRSMDVYMAKLRKYLAEDESVSLTSLHGGGYQLSAN